MASCGCWFQNKLKYLFFIHDVPYPTTSHFSFTTGSELVWAQET